MIRNIADTKVFISSVIPAIGIDMLRNVGFQLTKWDDKIPISQDVLIQKAKECHALLCTLTAKIDEHFLQQCKHLEIISQFGVGYDNINVAEATKLGIPVGNTPGVLTDATADIAFGLMIAASRKMFFMHKKLRRVNGNILHQYLILV